jgi:carboxyl-terminal processing protease
MTIRIAARRTFLSVVAGLALVAGPLSSSAAQPQAPARANATDWSQRVWQLASLGKSDELLTTLDQLPKDSTDPALVHLRASIDSLRANIAKREADRAEELKKVSGDLDKHLAEGGTDKALSEAIKAAVEMSMIVPDKAKAGVVKDPRVVGLVKQADEAARRAEARADWMTAWELYGRLNILLEEQGTYRDDVKRQGQRLTMIRLYAPKRSWEMRNQKRIADGEKPLPPYNGAGDDFGQKLKGITAANVARAIERAARGHVERVPLSTMLAGGLDSIRTLVSTPDVYAAFPKLADASARGPFVEFLDKETAALRRPGAVPELDGFLDRLIETNNATGQIAEAALLHELGNGAMGALDEFSAIIWPDEVRNFDKQTQGRFVGVGIQIQLDEMQNIKVVTPLDNSPALKAGVHPGDLIKKVNGDSTEGFTLDQAVDQITGPEGTMVTLTLERATPGVEEKKLIDMTMERTTIPLYTVKGWRREGRHETDWDWVIDHDSGIGYIRLTQFTDKSTSDFDAALRRMEHELAAGGGLKGLIFDMRFNPGGLLTEAISIANRFIDHGVLVRTKFAGDRRETAESAKGGVAKLNTTPVVVLVNENSASASEIVSGAIKDYAAKGDVRAVVVGARSYGKGSVQNVYDLDGQGRMRFKLTTQYWMLPTSGAIHKRPGQSQWGVEPNLAVDLLPKQTTDGFKLRQDADVIPLDENGQASKSAKPLADPEDLFAKGLDPQLQTALVILQAQALPASARQAMANK